MMNFMSYLMGLLILRSPLFIHTPFEANTCVDGHWEESGKAIDQPNIG